MNLKEKAEYCLRRAESLDNKRSNRKNRWQKQAEFCYPSRAFITKTKTEGDRGEDPLEVVDSTGIRSTEILASSLYGTLTGPHLNWFATQIKRVSGQLPPGMNSEKDLMDRQSVRIWNQGVTRAFRDEFAEGNFYSQMSELYLDMVALGSPGLWMEDMYDERDDRMSVCFDAMSSYENIVEEDAWGRVDTHYKFHNMTIKAILDRWPNAANIESIQKKIKSGDNAYADEMDMLQALYRKRNDDFTLSTDHQYPYLQILKDGKEILNLTKAGTLEAYTYMPAIFPRWSKAINEVYGDCPASSAMPDITSLNTLWGIFLQSADVWVRPYIFSEQGNLVNPDLGIVPGQETVVKNIEKTRIVSEQNPSIQIAYQMFERFQTNVEKTFLIDQLQFPPLQTQGTPITATEVQARFELMQRILGPMFGRFVYELVKPLIDNMYHIMVRRPSKYRTIPDFPEPGIEIERINVEYIGPLRVSQQMPEMVASQSLAAEAIQVSAQQGMPQFAIDIDKYLFKRGQETFVWPEILRDPDDAAKMREEFMQQQQAMAQAQMLQQASQGGKNLAQAAAIR